jgi:hypothetical protein
MSAQEKMMIIDALIKKGSVSITQFIMEYNGTTIISGDETANRQKAAESAGGKKAVLEYVGRLLPVVDGNYKEDYTNIWQDILAEDAVSKVVYDRGRQKGTVFNRNLVAHISRMMVLEGIFIEQTNDVMMAELLEPEKGKDHPVRTQLGLTPDDIQVKKAVERVFKQHGVKVK